jgi:hypothetical protein
MYNKHMKRTNLVLHVDLLEEATRVLGAKTYSAAVNAALAEVLRIRKVLSLPSFFNRGLWVGNLAEMREDHTRTRIRRTRKTEKTKK